MGRVPSGVHFKLVVDVSCLLLSLDNIRCNWIYAMFNRLWTIQPRLMLPIKFWGWLNSLSFASLPSCRSNNGWLALVGKLEITICSSWVPTIDQITHPEGIYGNQPQEEGFLTRTRLQHILKKNACSCLLNNIGIYMAQGKKLWYLHNNHTEDIAVLCEVQIEYS